MTYKEEPRYRKFEGYEIVIIYKYNQSFSGFWTEGLSHIWGWDYSARRSDANTLDVINKQLKSSKLKKYLKDNPELDVKVVKINMSFDFLD